MGKSFPTFFYFAFISAYENDITLNFVEHELKGVLKRLKIKFQTPNPITHTHTQA